MKRFRLPILTYHNISDTIEYYIAVRFSTFKKQFQTLSQKFTYIDLDSAFRAFRKNTPLTNRFSITFDDGYQDNIQALRFLNKHKAKATLFIPADYIGRDNRWNFKATYIAPVLNTRQIQDLSNEGHLIGSHGKTHQCLTKLPTKEIRDELVESRNTLEKIIQREVNYFAYPFGYHDSRIRRLTAEYYQAAFATNKTANSNEWKDAFQIRRFSVNRDTSLEAIIDHIKSSYE